MLSVIRVSGCKRLISKCQTRSSHVDAYPQEAVRAKQSNAQLSGEQRGRRQWATPRQASIRARSPAGTPKSEVITQLMNNFQVTNSIQDKPCSKTAPLDSKSDQALVILATPGFANWLEDTHFISEVLKTLTRQNGDSSALLTARDRSSPNAPEVPPFEVDVLCACVDGLAPRVEYLLCGSSKLTAPTVDEGFSFLHGQTQQIVPALWEPATTNIRDSPGMLSSLAFSADANASQITLPLANTLFRNGRSSTLLISKWQYKQDETFVRLRSEEKTHQLVNAFQKSQTGMPSHYFPVVPLTPARRIVSGLGNIVRQVQYDEGVGPASRELEANIEDYQKSTGLPASTVNVWALVVPPELVSDYSTESPNDIFLDADSVKRFWTPSSLGIMNTTVGSWIERGAKVCRVRELIPKWSTSSAHASFFQTSSDSNLGVVSGGGGWGAKQGLLSLDPQTSYTTVSEARFDFSGGSLEEQQASVLGNIASPAALIQFFLAPGWERTPEEFVRSPSRKVDSADQISTVIGVVPSTVDSIPGPVTPDGHPNVQSPLVYLDMGHFGAVSESGMYYSSSAVKDAKPDSTRDVQHQSQTKIDVPYSYMFTEFKEAERKPLSEVPDLD